MPNFNKVIIMGNLTRDPEMRYTKDGSAVCRFGMAINRVYYDANQERQEEVCWVDLTAWDKQAESISEYLSKGSPVLVEGRLSYRQWEKDGTKRSKLEVVAERVQFLGTRPEAHETDEDDDIPF